MTPTETSDLSYRRYMVMAQLQDELNELVQKDWHLAKNDWGAFAMVEAGELLDHYGWKWWKHQEQDLQQAKLEAIDLLHIALSIHLEITFNTSNSSGPYDKNLDISTVAFSFSNYSYLETAMTLFPTVSLALKDIVIGAAAGPIPLASFNALCGHLGLDEDEIFSLYLGKNALNIFRQRNGYKDGTYTKHWDGLEDNQHLEAIMNEATTESIEPEEMMDWVLNKLQSCYVS